jgi:hypothetical protein
MKHITTEELKQSVLSNIGNQDQQDKFSKLITYSALSVSFFIVGFAGWSTGYTQAQAECIHGQSMNRSTHQHPLQQNPEVATMNEFQRY